PGLQLLDRGGVYIRYGGGPTFGFDMTVGLAGDGFPSSLGLAAAFFGKLGRRREPRPQQGRDGFDQRVVQATRFKRGNNIRRLGAGAGNGEKQLAALVATGSGK